ncbi:hypothetical protein GWK47_035115 [Chionoecetes opilio]|uniref:Uncharacterized protein n=1 Tax=Chionoecetes opilio TaxID=41210 RepID=A0A8J4YU93_CHIOP|nr:hypothetical protein GWK47_035115 [Chionoecetes opilio]
MGGSSCRPLPSFLCSSVTYKSGVAQGSGTIDHRTPDEVTSRPNILCKMKVFVLACMVGVAMCAPQQQRYDAPPPQEERYEAPPPQKRYDGHIDSKEIIFKPEPYQFSHAIADDEFTNYQTRYESQDEHGNVEGEYSWVGPDSIRYITKYTADAINGFQVNTIKEQTDIVIRFPEPVPEDKQDGYYSSA